jgi:uncharacterized protein (TIGR03118 family)
MDFKIRFLTSNVFFTSPIGIRPAADFLDSNLSNPWGLVISSDTIYVANADSTLITLYSLAGAPLTNSYPRFPPGQFISTISTGEDRPTGIVFNDFGTQSYWITNGLDSLPASLIICTLEGTLWAYSQALNPGTAIRVVPPVNPVDQSASYTGLALTQNYIYVADFLNGKIDTYDTNFVLVTTGFPFADQLSGNPIPVTFAPYNIVLIGCQLFVTYAAKDSNNNLVVGASLGYVSIFDLDGSFVRRFVSGDVLNAPWGLIEAPIVYGYPPGAIVIASYGSGTFDVFDINGKWYGPIRDRAQNIIRVNGLRGLALQTYLDLGCGLINRKPFGLGCCGSGLLSKKRAPDEIFFTAFNPGPRDSFLGKLYSGYLESKYSLNCHLKSDCIGYPGYDYPYWRGCWSSGGYGCGSGGCC